MSRINENEPNHEQQLFNTPNRINNIWKSNTSNQHDILVQKKQKYTSQQNWVVVSNIFLFSPLLGEMIQFD